MADPGALLEELETAVSRGTAQSRRAALAYATDLLITGRYSDEHTWMFGEIIGLLASEIKAAAPRGWRSALPRARVRPPTLSASSPSTIRSTWQGRCCGIPSSSALRR